MDGGKTVAKLLSQPSIGRRLNWVVRAGRIEKNKKLAWCPRSTRPKMGTRLTRPGKVMSVGAMLTTSSTES